MRQRDQKWYTYIIVCKNNALYTGITNNLERRFKEHHKKTARYTSYNPPVKIVYSETHPTQSQAAKRESQIKSWPRQKKLSLMHGDKRTGHEMIMLKK